jgi:putative hydroxymethylpyrimidine transport system substrate-binding protein
MRRTLAVAAGVFAAALALSACGEIRNQIDPVAARASPLTLALGGPTGSADVGIYEARSNGDLLRAGVSLDIRTPTDSAQTLSLVESGKDDVGIISEPELMLARNRGATVLGFGALTQRPFTSLVSLSSRHVHSASDLTGRTLGTIGQTADAGLLDTALGRAGVARSSVTQVALDPGRLVAAMLSGRIDAAFGGNADEQTVALRARHKRVTVTPVTSLGVPNYDDLVFVTTELYFADHDNLLRRFVQAIGRGYTAVRADPSAGVSALHAADPSLDVTLQSAAVRAELPAFFPGNGESWGWQVQHQWNVFGRWMTAQQLIDGPQAWEAASTNQLLAGQGP